MLYMVEATADREYANKIDATEGPGKTFIKIAERFRPQAFFGIPTRRSIMMIVELETPAKMAELMYAITWFSGGEPTFTPLMKPEVFEEALKNAKQIVSPAK
jgi:hypothetical protein